MKPKSPLRMSIRRILSASIYISLFMILTYAMTAYGFFQGEAEFTTGAQIGCIILGLLCATFSYVMWCVIVGGYDLLTSFAVRISGVIEERVKAAEARASEATAAGTAEAETSAEPSAECESQ